MAKKIKYVKNAPLEVGDNVVCMHMADDFSAVAGGTPGIVQTVSNVGGQNIYYVKWRSGSKLALLEDVDMWKKVVEEDDDEEGQEGLAEGILFVTTKNNLLKEIKRKKY
jgi:hypothetical protein